jgi:hypothetical protein
MHGSMGGGRNLASVGSVRVTLAPPAYPTETADRWPSRASCRDHTAAVDVSHPSVSVVSQRVGLGAMRGRTDEDRPPICPVCGVTMVPAELSMHLARQRDWVCLECEETDEPDVT